MRTIKQMVDALLGEKRQPEIPRQATVTTGIVRVGSNLELCHASDRRRGVKLVTIAVYRLERLDRIQQEHKAAQAELKAIPKSRRARKRKMKIVSLPGNPQNQTAAGWGAAFEALGHAAAIEGKA